MYTMREIQGETSYDACHRCNLQQHRNLNNVPQLFFFSQPPASVKRDVDECQTFRKLRYKPKPRKKTACTKTHLGLESLGATPPARAVVERNIKNAAAGDLRKDKTACLWH